VVPLRVDERFHCAREFTQPGLLLAT
jgi:hypothetical protein